MSEELKPCPFCGSTEIRYGYGPLFPVVWCNKCDAQVQDVDDVDDAIKLWNTRPIEDALNKRVAELEESATKANEILVDYMGQWAGVNELYLPENILPIYNAICILRGEG